MKRKRDKKEKTKEYTEDRLSNRIRKEYPNANIIKVLKSLLEMGEISILEYKMEIELLKREVK
jgi:hypothetical protein